MQDIRAYGWSRGRAPLVSDIGTRLSGQIHPTAALPPSQRTFCTINLQEPCVLYIGRAYRYPPDVAFYTLFFSTTISTEYFKHAAHSPFFSSKCRLFHNATFFFGSCIIHILHTGVLKFKCKI